MRVAKVALAASASLAVKPASRCQGCTDQTRIFLFSSTSQSFPWQKEADDPDLRILLTVDRRQRHHKGIRSSISITFASSVISIAALGVQNWTCVFFCVSHHVLLRTGYMYPLTDRC